jgi:hypothetical protein
MSLHPHPREPQFFALRGAANPCVSGTAQTAQTDQKLDSTGEFGPSRGQFARGAGQELPRATDQNGFEPGFPRPGRPLS